MTARMCQACGAHPLRSDNKSGRCEACRRANRSIRPCAGGCGRKLDVRARHALCRRCAIRLSHRIAMQLATLAEREGVTGAVDLFEAAVAFSRRSYSETRAADFETALVAFGAKNATLLTGKDPT